MDTSIRLKRLYFRSAHRGSKETDLILGPYAREHLSRMNQAELDVFEAFLDENDSDIWDWVSGNVLLTGTQYDSLIAQLQAFHAAA